MTAYIDSGGICMIVILAAVALSALQLAIGCSACCPVFIAWIMT